MHTRSCPLKLTSWLPWAAWAAFAVTVPAAVWRVLMILGLMPGTADLRRFEIAGDPAWAYTYVGMLSLVQLVAGYAAVGLVQPWGENVRGRRVPLAPVLAIATLGGLTVTWIFDFWMVSALLAGQRPDAGLVSGAPLIVMVCCYAPLLLWARSSWSPRGVTGVAGGRRRQPSPRRRRSSLPRPPSIPGGAGSFRPHLRMTRWGAAKPAGRARPRTAMDTERAAVRGASCVSGSSQASCGPSRLSCCSEH